MFSFVTQTVILSPHAISVYERKLRFFRGYGAGLNHQKQLQYNNEDLFIRWGYCGLFERNEEDRSFL